MLAPLRIKHQRMMKGPAASRAYTLLELVTTVVVVGLLAALALPTYAAILERQKNAQAVRDLATIGMSLQRFYTNHFRFPLSLEEIGADDLRDPWGNPYRYLNFDADIPGIKGKIRKDHNLHPINNDFDLYSSGPDGKSVGPLTAKASRDDIVYARDGGFIGRAEDF